MLIKKLYTTALKYWESFYTLFFPSSCCVCGGHLSNNEDLICTKCLCELPRTNYHIYKDNPVAIVFYGRVNIENATSFFHFVKSSKYSGMMYKLKYKGNSDIGVLMGRYFGRDIMRAPGFSDIDIIVPVPLHKRKLKIRGYNQSECIAKGMSWSMKKEVLCDNLVRNEFTPTQTRKSRTERWANVEGKFKVLDPKAIVNKHILLVDDVVTTGATLEACAQELLKVKGVKVSVATLAKA